MSTIYSGAFWRAAAERAIKTAAQSAAGLIVASSTGLIGIDYMGGASVVGAAALLSLLTSIGSDALTGDGPSMTTAEKVKTYAGQHRA